MTRDTDTDYGDVLYAAFAQRYRDGQDSWSTESAMRELVPMLLPRLAPGSRVLDIGAGRGPDTVALLTAGHRVTATDLVRLPDWDALGTRWQDRVTFFLGDITLLPAEEKFHAAVDNGVLHHQDAERYDEYLAAVRGHLHPGGLLAISLFTTARENPEGRLNRADDGRLSRWFTEPEARALLTEAGFAPLAVRRVRRRLEGLAYLLVIATTATRRSTSA
ncbi:class I SAM-dependent methyltransferase [Streptomyces sp. NPDC026672]|uniref:SAM-dependent methyltransferase n=1 Tax=unclassified Streptomyces TaxID=2593676 RepID=UPI0033DD31DD